MAWRRTFMVLTSKLPAAYLIIFRNKRKSTNAVHHNSRIFCQNKITATKQAHTPQSREGNRHHSSAAYKHADRSHASSDTSFRTPNLDSKEPTLSSINNVHHNHFTTINQHTSKFKKAVIAYIFLEAPTTT